MDLAKWSSLASVITFVITLASFVLSYSKRKKEQTNKNIQEAEALLEKITMLPVIIENFINSNQPYYVTKEITRHQQRPAEQSWSARSAMIPITIRLGSGSIPIKKSILLYLQSIFQQKML